MAMFPIINGEYNEFCESEVILMVDNREKRNAQDVNYFFDRFEASGIKTELKSLPLGDFLWVLRIRNHDQYIDEDDV
jgi:ERCC4-type nuclease